MRRIPRRGLFGLRGHSLTAGDATAQREDDDGQRGKYSTRAAGLDGQASVPTAPTAHGPSHPLPLVVPPDLRRLDRRTVLQRDPVARVRQFEPGALLV